jgi:hypothetical protein
MSRLFWSWIAPVATVLAGIAVLCLAVYPHCFFQQKNRTVQIDGVVIEDAGVFSNDSSWNELVLVPNKDGAGYAIYSADLQGEVAGLLNNGDTIRLPRMVVVRDASRFSNLVEKEIYDPSLKPGDLPQRFHFAADVRRVDVSFRPSGKQLGVKWPPVANRFLLVFLAAWLFLAPVVFLGSGWWSIKRQSDPTAASPGKLPYVLLFASISWLGFLVTTIVDALLQRGYDQRVAFWSHVGTMRGVWTSEIWVGVLGGVVCILASLASRGPSRRSAIYTSFGVVLMWFFVGIIPG